MSGSQEFNKIVLKLESSDISTRDEAIRKLIKSADTLIVDKLLRLLEESSSRVARESICNALGKIGDKRAVPILTKIVLEEEESVRYQATIALGLLGDQRAVPVLLEVVQNTSYPLVRSEAVKSLGLLGDKRALKPLLEILKKEKSDRFIQYHTITSLGQIGNKKAAKALRKVIKNSKDDRMVLRALEALDAIDEKRKKRT